MIHQGRQRLVFSSRRLPRSSVHRPGSGHCSAWSRVAPWSRLRADGQDDIGLACEMVGGDRPRTPTMPGAQGWSWERLALPAIVSATGIPRRIAKSASAPPPANSARRRHGADPMGRASIRPAPLGLMAPIGAGSSTAARDRWSAASEGPLSHFLTERAPLKPLSNRLTLWKRRRSFRET